MKDSSGSRPVSERLSGCNPSLLPRTRTSRALHDWHLKLGSAMSAWLLQVLRPSLAVPCPTTWRVEASHWRGQLTEVILERWTTGNAQQMQHRLGLGLTLTKLLSACNSTAHNSLRCFQPLSFCDFIKERIVVHVCVLWCSTRCRLNPAHCLNATLPDSDRNVTPRQGQASTGWYSALGYGSVGPDITCELCMSWPGWTGSSCAGARIPP